MKYLEEIKAGDSFFYDNIPYILTYNFKQNKQTTSTSHACIRIDNGSMEWLDSSTIIDSIDLYFIDKDRNIIQLKQNKDDNSNQNYDYTELSESQFSNIVFQLYS